MTIKDVADKFDISCDILRNYVRIANVWLDDEYRALFYNASNIKVKNGKVNYSFGDISGGGGETG